MDETIAAVLGDLTGKSIDLVVYDNGVTRLFKTVVDLTNPLRLRVVEGDHAILRSGRQVMLLSRAEGNAFRADGHLDTIRRDNKGCFLEIGKLAWELLERRRHVRVAVETRVTLSAVEESDEGPRVRSSLGETFDLSDSGAFVKMDEPAAEGSLVECTLHLGKHEVRVLAMVAHHPVDQQGVGLHFVEYLGDAKPKLQQFLTEQAA